MKDSAELESYMSNFIGTENYYVMPLYRWMKYTDGVKGFAENAGNGAYWFLDIIGTELMILANHEDFMSIVMHSKDGGAYITADDGNGKILWSKKINFTDCPEGEWKFFLQHTVLMAASEY